MTIIDQMKSPVQPDAFILNLSSFFKFFKDIAHHAALYAKFSVNSFPGITLLEQIYSFITVKWIYFSHVLQILETNDAVF